MGGRIAVRYLVPEACSVPNKLDGVATSKLLSSTVVDSEPGHGKDACMYLAGDFGLRRYLPWFLAQDPAAS